MWTGYGGGYYSSSVHRNRNPDLTAHHQHPQIIHTHVENYEKIYGTPELAREGTTATRRSLEQRWHPRESRWGTQA